MFVLIRFIRAKMKEIFRFKEASTESEVDRLYYPECVNKLRFGV